VIKPVTRRLYLPFPDELWARIEHADSLTVYLLHPAPRPRAGGPTFHGYPVLGRVEVDDSAIAGVVERLRKGLYGRSSPKRCWIPHHGVRASAGRQSVDLVLCFMCEVMQHFTGPRSKNFVWGQVGKAPKALLNRVLRKAGVLHGSAPK
jgi:hypothetical protein